MAAQLLRASVTIDESHLQHFIRATIDQVAEQFKRDMHVVHRNVTQLNEKVDFLSDTVTELSEKTVPGLVKDLADIQENGSPRRGRSGRSFASLVRGSNPGSVADAPLSRGSSPGAGAGPSSARSKGGSSGAGGCLNDGDLGEAAESVNQEMGGDLDEDEQAFLQLSNQVRELQEKVKKCEDTLENQDFNTASLQSSVEAYQKVSDRNFTRLLDFIGLENNETYGGIIRAQVLANNHYLSEVHVLLDETSKRTTVVEANVKTKIDKTELDEMNFAISDIRGVADAAVSTFSQKEQAMKNSITDFVKKLREEGEAKVSWTDLDKWQASLDETSSATRKTSIEAVQGLERLEKEFTIFKQSCLPPAGSLSSLPYNNRFSSSHLSPGQRSITPPPSQTSASQQQPSDSPSVELVTAAATTGDNSVRRKLAGATQYAQYAEVKQANELVPSRGQTYQGGGVVLTTSQKRGQRPYSAASMRRNF